MNFYSYDEIKAAITCVEAARMLGVNLDRRGRCAATWRNGTNPESVHIEHDNFYDHTLKQGGSVIDLVAAVKFDGDVQKAQAFLGEYLKLEPKVTMQPDPTTRCRYDRLIAEGYAETARYDYRNADNVVVLQVIRLEKDGAAKSFVQYDPRAKRWTVKDVDVPLYNLPNIVHCDWVAVVEGEKDADRLIAEGWPATTCAGGAKKWQPTYTETLAGKSVVIIRDNDDAGNAHAYHVANCLVKSVREVRIICPSSKDKGDVSTFFDDGGSVKTLFQMVKNQKALGDDVNLSEQAALAEARGFKGHTFYNYTIKKSTSPAGKPTTKKVPRHILAMVEECRKRFLGFPVTLCGQLFDHCRKTNDIQVIRTSAELFSWIGCTGSCHIDFARADDMVTAKVFLEALRQTARDYVGVSQVPDWPRRDNVYYMVPKLPAPDPEHTYFRRFIDFFNPATPADLVLLKAFTAAPLYYAHRVPRPVWVIDSDHGQGTGKTTIAQVIGSLYGGTVDTTLQELKSDTRSVKRRLLTPDALSKRVFLVDNVTGKLANGDIASLITAWDVNDRPVYGTNDARRPNDLTYVITANSATFDTDLSSRAFFIFVKRATMATSWLTDLLKFVDSYRLNIFADITDILNRHTPFSGIEPCTRFSQFESKVLQAMCENIDEYEAVIRSITERKDAANSDEELAYRIEDTVRAELLNLNLKPDAEAVFVRTDVVEEWLRSFLPRRAIQTVRNLAKVDMIKYVDPRVTRYPHNSHKKRSGLMWRPPNVASRTEKSVIFSGDKVIVIAL